MINALRKIHFYTALITGLFLTIICISGGLLIFADSLDKQIFPQQWQAKVEGDIGNLAAMIDVVETTTSDTVKTIDIGQGADDVWRFSLTSGKYANFDPYQMKVTKYYEYHEHIYGFTLILHRWLIFQDAQGNKPLQNWVSIVSLSLIINMLIGIYLWMKPKHPLKRLRVRWTSNKKILFSQLHNVVGVICLLPLMLIAVSGIAFNWQTPVKYLVESVMFDDIESRPSINYIADPSAPHLPLSELVAKGTAVLKSGILFRIYLPTENQPLKLRIKMPQETHAYSWVWVNPSSGDIIESYNGGQANLVTQVWNFKYKFHIGQFINPSIEWLWLVLCLLPIILLYTGLWVKLKRRKR